MKNHAWLVCSDVVLTRMCLVDKGVECVPHCLLCENHDETLRHVFCLFPQVLSVGNRLSYGSRLNQLCNLHQTCNNCFLHLAEIETPQEVAARSHLVWDDWKLAQTSNSRNPHLAQVTAESSWKKPPSDIVTIT